MKLFLAKISLYITGFFLLSVIVLFASSKMAYKKIVQKGRAVVIDKNKRLDSLPSPKIILIGGSNVSYGINSEIIEDSLHMPVVDMSINANMGMVFYYNQVKHSLKKGDIVIGIPEYVAYQGETMQGNSGTYALGIIEKKNFDYLTHYQWLRFPLFTGDLIKDNYTAIFSSSIKNKVNTGRYLYNACGDYIGHHNDTTQNSSFKTIKTFDFNKQEYKVDENFVKLINSFALYAKEKGSLYLHAYPVYPKPFFSIAYANKMREALPGITWIGSPTQYLYNFEELYDSPNHLLYNKIEDRTIKLVADIKTELRK